MVVSLVIYSATILTRSCLYKRLLHLHHTLSALGGAASTATTTAALSFSFSLKGSVELNQVDSKKDAVVRECLVVQYLL